ncbi:hypothetical protein BO86DRAFT_447011 [Aspergillus japonicus CBS 114.51]|uniref:Protein kinase domain-containing protein n=1 Tax=Aspergillus japonicus CBS 114.51 TaxID=1448312 RepID=A0A8T8X7E2_ASPJA|nr:hypothetical protein BO86DRAFT_447011 [Aspergillus japonicus CBS 114.51]RAH83552.1 hypothetical protein BO86DRAFT_447011 [Aspergillus japonicus CBS 114.51]
MSLEIEELRRQLADAEQRISASHQRSSKTNLPTFLDGLHKHLFLGLQVQPDETQSSRGDPANTTNKLRPRYLRAWDTLAKLDLNHFLRQTVEDHVSKIIEELYKDPVLRQAFGLRGSIRFQNHSDALSPEQELVEGLQSVVSCGRPARRRSPRLAEREERASSAATRQPKTPRRVRTTRPRADQSCVYNIPNEISKSTHCVAAYIKEYKSPHKVTLGHIYEELGDIDVDEVILEKADEPSKVRFQRALLGLLSQPFDYMVHARTQVGVFTTGEVDIYLRIGEDPFTLFYHLSVPKGDVGQETGWDPCSDRPNRLHLTAVGQALAFTLQALRLRPWSQAWGLQATNTLPTWEVVPADILDDVSDQEVPSSEYRPPKPAEFLRSSPIQPRRRRPKLSTSDCRPLHVHNNRDEDDDPMHRAGNHACPNVRDHGQGTTRHVISSKTFVCKLQRQLSETVNADCETIGIHGSRGALLNVTLSSHGYTVPATCTVSEFRDRHRHEAAVYDKLRSNQGIYIPLYLGSIDLAHPYSYDGIAYLEHMMLLSPSGQSLDLALTELGRTSIHSRNVLHKDPAPRNWSYNPESKHVVFFDYERAELIEPRPILSEMSPNRKRKRTEHGVLD